MDKSAPICRLHISDLELIFRVGEVRQRLPDYIGGNYEMVRRSGGPILGVGALFKIGCGRSYILLIRRSCGSVGHSGADHVSTPDGHPG